MSGLEKKLRDLLILSIILFVVVYFMLDRRFGEPPVLEDEEIPKYAVLVNPHERGVEQDALKSKTVDTPELDEFAYEAPSFQPMFGARNKEVRLILANLYGGGERTENAVEMGVAYLARIQNPDGSWSSSKNPIGSTGLAMLCFLGAGYHHMDGDYKDNAGRGLEYLLSRQTSTGAMNGENLYSSGIAGTVFAEAYGLTGDPRCKDASLKMMEYLSQAQGSKGGWGYGPIREGAGANARYDTSVTGWIIMSFKSARMVGLPVPEESIALYKKYALYVTNSAGLAHYALNKGKLEGPSQTMTASTLMCRLYMGEGMNARLIRPGLRKLTKELPGNLRPKWIEKDNTMDNYLWYHAAQVAFLVGRETWDQWNDMLVDLLVRHQIKEGDRKGSWDDQYFKWTTASEVYPTTLNIMVLETYYRYYH